MMIDFIADNAGMIGLLFFFFFFTAVAAWTFRPGSKEEYQGHALIPLQDDKE